jgi:ERCC4-type nuclease
MRIPTELKSEQVTAVVDTRERTPWDLSPMRMIRNTLTTGDYTVVGLEHVVRLERKTLPDLLQCVGRCRSRFEREVRRLLAYPVRALVVESSWCRIESGQYNSQIPPDAVVGSLLGWMATGLPVIMAGDRRRASRYAKRLMMTVARRRWRELRELARLCG